MITQQFILDVWERMETDIVGAAELTRIQEAVAQRFSGDAGLLEISPAAIARILADHGARLRHPEILEADVRWRERRDVTILSDDFNGSSFVKFANSLIERLQSLKNRSERNMQQAARKLKSEFELIATHRSDLEGEWAKEISAWLKVLLETPQLARDWIALRIATPEYKDLVSRYEKLSR